MKFKDYYEILGVKRDASADDIKRAYRKAARKYHPDVSKEPDAEARFKEVGEAYEVLKDQEKRAAYDKFGENWKNGQDFRPPPDWEKEFSFGGGGFTDASGFSDFFESLFGGRGFSGPGGPRGQTVKGGDQHAELRISLEDAYEGATRTINLREPGAGGETKQRSLNVRIPKGVVDGQRIRLSGQGSPGMRGSDRGDLYLTVAVAPHRRFAIEGRDVILELPIAPWEAALGATVEVPTLGGRVDLKIPPGSQTGNRLRLRGRGMKGTPPGDQIVVLKTVVPRAASKQARELYEQMEKTLGFDPRAELKD